MIANQVRKLRPDVGHYQIYRLIFQKGLQLLETASEIQKTIVKLGVASG